MEKVEFTDVKELLQAAKTSVKESGKPLSSHERVDEVGFCSEDKLFYMTVKSLDEHVEREPKMKSVFGSIKDREQCLDIINGFVKSGDSEVKPESSEDE